MRYPRVNKVEKSLRRLLWDEVLRGALKSSKPVAARAERAAEYSLLLISCYSAHFFSSEILLSFRCGDIVSYQSHAVPISIGSFLLSSLALARSVRLLTIAFIPFSLCAAHYSSLSLRRLGPLFAGPAHCVRRQSDENICALFLPLPLSLRLSRSPPRFTVAIESNARSKLHPFTSRPHRM